jgi:hypothetical protein
MPVSPLPILGGEPCKLDQSSRKLGLKVQLARLAGVKAQTGFRSYREMGDKPRTHHADVVRYL